MLRVCLWSCRWGYSDPQIAENFFLCVLWETNLLALSEWPLHVLAGSWYPMLKESSKWEKDWTWDSAIRRDRDCHPGPCPSCPQKQAPAVKSSHPLPEHALSLLVIWHQPLKSIANSKDYAISKAQTKPRSASELCIHISDTQRGRSEESQKTNKQTKKHGRTCLDYQTCALPLIKL